MKIQKRIIPYLFLLGVFCFLSNAQAIELTYQFSDPEYGYTVQYPSDWVAGKYRSGVILSEINSKDGESGLQIRLISSRQDINNFVDSYARSFQKDMGATLLAKKMLILNQTKGYTIRFKAHRGGKDYLLKSYVFPNENQTGYYVFQAGAPYVNKRQIEPVLDAIAFSFKK